MAKQPLSQGVGAVLLFRVGVHLTSKPVIHFPSYINSFGVYQDFYVRKYLTNYTPSAIGYFLLFHIDKVLISTLDG